jgi:hypothetical protein
MQMQLGTLKRTKKVRSDNIVLSRKKKEEQEDNNCRCGFPSRESSSIGHY